MDPQYHVDRLTIAGNLDTDVDPDMYVIYNKNPPIINATQQWKIEGNNIINSYDNQCMYVRPDYSIVMRPCKSTGIWDIIPVFENVVIRNDIPKYDPNINPVAKESSGLTSTQLGLVIGVPLGIILLILVIALIMCKMKKS